MTGCCTFTVFRYSRPGEYAPETGVDLECPPDLPPLIIRMEAENSKAFPDYLMSKDLQDFFNVLWRERILPFASDDKIAAASLSYMGYSYWVAMSTDFFNYAKAAGIIGRDIDFKHRTASGFLVKDL